MDNPAASIDWRIFLPGQTPLALLTQGVATTTDVSALFIWATLLVYTAATLWQAYRGMAALRAVQFFFRLIQGVHRDTLPAQRRDLRQRAITPLGRLWLEFDATWVSSSDGRQLYQTQSAEVFFHAQALAPGLIGNRLLASVPGVLTAFGILGTFVGLQIGLAQLDLSSPQVLTQSIVPLIQGSAVAFATSVWGTAISILFNAQEKFLEQWLLRRVRRLQVQIDALLPRHSSEQTLAHIEQASREAENALKGLAEQIGVRMQEALLEVPNKIETGISAAMAPAMDKLVQAAERLADKQSGSAHEALAALVQQFTQTVSQSGEHSRQGLETVTHDLTAALGEWRQGMEQFLGKLGQRAGEFDSQMGNLLEQGKTLRDEGSLSRQALAKAATELRASGALLQQATQHLQQFARDAGQAARHLGEAHMHSARLAETAAQRQEAALAQLEPITTALAQAHAGMRGAAESLQISAETAKNAQLEASTAQKAFVEDLRKILTQLRKQTSQLMTDYAIDVREQTRERLEIWNSQTQEFAKNLVAAVSAMHEILQEIDGLLEQRGKPL